MTSTEWYKQKIQKIIDKDNRCMKRAELLAIKIDEVNFTDGYAVKLHEQVYNKLTEFGKTYKELLEFMGVNCGSSITRQYEFWCKIEKEIDELNKWIGEKEKEWFRE